MIEALSVVGAFVYLSIGLFVAVESRDDRLDLYIETALGIGIMLLWPLFLVVGFLAARKK